MRSPDPADLIRRQAGVIGRQQALECGLTERQVSHRLQTGRWSRLLPGVYLSADAALSWSAHAHALVIAAGSGATVIGDSAAALRGLFPRRLPITVAIPAARRCTVQSQNLRLLRLDIPDADRVTIEGLPTTSRQRTAVDLAHLLPFAESQPVVDRMLVLGQVDLAAFTESIEGSRRYGSAQARALATSANDHAAAESERIARRILHQAGIKGWVGNYEIQVGVHTLKIDLALVRLRIGVEVKGWIFHSLSDRAASDDRRVIDLQLTDWIVIPVGCLALSTKPDQFVADVRAAIAFRERGVA